MSDSGMVKFAKELQFRKAPNPMVVTEFEMVKFVREQQFRKAQNPMDC